MGLKNQASIALFRQLHFVEVSTSQVFQEVTLVCEGQALAQLWQLAASCPVQLCEYAYSYEHQHMGGSGVQAQT